MSAALPRSGLRGAELPPEPTPPDVLIINSYAPGYEWSDDMLAGILGALRQEFREFEPVLQYLDFRRFPDPAREAWLLDDVVHKCHVQPPRLIITVDNAAFDFALKHRAELGATIPLVFAGVNRFAPDMIAGQRHITGVSEESDFSGTFTLIEHLRPAARHVLVISNESESSVETRMAFAVHAPKHEDRYDFEYYEHWTNEELIARVARLPEDWVGLILDVTRDATGHNNYNNTAFTEALASRSSVPIFLTSRPPGDNDWSVFSWDGIGGGMVVADVHGAKVGELALRILAGEDADAIPVVRHSPQRLEVDFRQMRRFGLSEKLLPPGTRVTNEPVTFYQINRSRLVLAAVVLLLLVGVIVVLSVNILRRQQAERALRRAEEHLRSSQKLEAVGQLAGGVAHDFNNITQIIRGHAAFLHEAVAGSPTQREDVETIQQAAERATQLTRQLLAFSRKQTLDTGPVDANTLVLDLIKMLRRVLGEHIELAVTPLPGPRPMVADKGQIEQLLLNLCVNARDAMPGGGRISIALEEVLIGPLEIRDQPELKPGPYLQLTVTDTGTGMTTDVRRRIFEPFFTTKEPTKGTGLGLAVAYGIVRQHEGTIRVTSEVGRGSTFTILLPFGSAPATPAKPRLENGFPPGEGTLLLAEDDPQVRRIAERILQRSGFRVLSAADGEEAETLIEQNHADIRLAILDVLMPKRNGREVFDFLRARHPHIRVLFCSGYSAEMLPPEIAPQAGVALLNKPYTTPDLLAHIHRLLET